MSDETLYTLNTSKAYMAWTYEVESCIYAIAHAHPDAGVRAYWTKVAHVLMLLDGDDLLDLRKVWRKAQPAFHHSDVQAYHQSFQKNMKALMGGEMPF